jgi:hypothetical protein
MIPGFEDVGSVRLDYNAEEKKLTGGVPTSAKQGSEGSARQRFWAGPRERGRESRAAALARRPKSGRGRETRPGRLHSGKLSSFFSICFQNHFK